MQRRACIAAGRPADRLSAYGQQQHSRRFAGPGDSLAGAAWLRPARSAPLVGGSAVLARRQSSRRAMERAVEDTLGNGAGKNQSRRPGRSSAGCGAPSAAVPPSAPAVWRPVFGFGFVGGRVGEGAAGLFGKILAAVGQPRAAERSAAVERPSASSTPNGRLYAGPGAAAFRLPGRGGFAAFRWAPLRRPLLEYRVIISQP